jgi:hypothetical protein
MLRSGKQRQVGRSPTARQLRPDTQAGRGYKSSNQGPFGRGIVFSEQAKAKATILNDLDLSKSARDLVQQIKLTESGPKTTNPEKGKPHSDSKSIRKMVSDKTHKSKESRDDSKKTASRKTTYDKKKTASGTTSDRRKNLFPTEQDMSRETLESLLQIFAVAMNFCVDKKLLAVFSEIGIKTDKQFIQATCAEVTDLFTAIFFSETIQHDKDDDDLDHYTYTSELVAIMVWIHE